jgi:hypothetical protein
MRIGPLKWLTSIPLMSMAIVLGFVTLALLGLSTVLKDDRWLIAPVVVSLFALGLVCCTLMNPPTTPAPAGRTAGLQVGEERREDERDLVEVEGPGGGSGRARHALILPHRESGGQTATRVRPSGTGRPHATGRGWQTRRSQSR